EGGTGGNFGDGGQVGFSVSLSDDGSTLAVGANAEDSNARGINGNQNDNSMQSAGAAYIFVRSGATWTQQAYVKAPNTAPNVQFGYSVALSADGNTFAVSAFDEAGSSRVVLGPDGPFTPGRNGTGAIYVYTRTGTAWALQAFIKASKTGKEDWFGSRLQLSGDGNTLAVAAQLEDSAAQGVDGKQDDDSAQEAGAVYFFTRTGTVWSQKHYVKSTNNEAF